MIDQNLDQEFGNQMAGTEQQDLENRRVDEPSNSNESNENVCPVDSNSVMAMKPTLINSAMEKDGNVVEMTNSNTIQRPDLIDLTSTQNGASMASVEHQNLLGLRTTENSTETERFSMVAKKPMANARANVNDRMHAEKRCSAIALHFDQQVQPNSLLDVRTSSNPIQTVNDRKGVDLKQLRKSNGNPATMHAVSGTQSPEMIDLILDDEVAVQLVGADVEKGVENMGGGLQPTLQRQNLQMSNANTSGNATKKTKSIKAMDRTKRLKCDYCLYCTNQKSHLNARPEWEYIVI